MGKLPVFGQQAGETLRHVAVCVLPLTITNTSEPSSYKSAQAQFYIPEGVEINDGNFRLYVGRDGYCSSSLPSGGGMEMGKYFSFAELEEIGQEELLLSCAYPRTGASWNLKFAAQAPVLGANALQTVSSGDYLTLAGSIRFVAVNIQMKMWNAPGSGGALELLPVQLRIFE